MHRRIRVFHRLYSRTSFEGCRQIFGKKLPTVISCYYSPTLRQFSTNQTSPLVAETSIKRDKYSQRTHNCGELTIANVGDKVELCGWVEFQRLDKFIILRDGFGSTQLIISVDKTELVDKMKNLSLESVVRAIGTVNPRLKSQSNPKMKSGEIEVDVESLEILNPANSQLPMFVKDAAKTKEQTRMQYRYLDIRSLQMQKNLRTRSKILMKMREFLVNKCNFVDVETPTLFRRTPGGAQEFVVPTKHAGKFYSLVQSPQQFKQLLMVGGIDRYFQIARCYRDESIRLDRQPEFTQLDIEMSFVDREGIMALSEDLMAESWLEEFGEINIPFERMTFANALEFYGTDKPDLRLPYKLQNLTDIVKTSDQLTSKTGIEYTEDFGTYAVVFPRENRNFSNSVKRDFEDIAKREYPGAKLVHAKISNGDSWKTGISSLLSRSVVDCIENRLNLQDGDMLFLSIGKKPTVQELLGRFLILFTNVLESKGIRLRAPGYKWVWVVDFPLFTKGNNDDALNSTHHPFTQPHPDDLHLLATEPSKIRGLHYDLVTNGWEIGGGSIRIHDSNLQRQVLEMLNIETSHMNHLINALASGAPPHGGIAFGLDRYIAMLCNAPSIRDVIAFPKTMEGRDLMSGAPVEISEKEKQLYHIRTPDD